MPLPERPNQRWSMDFVMDSIADGRRFRALTIVDDFTKECPAIEADFSISGLRVANVLDRLAQSRGLPQAITIDNGPEFSGKALDAWAFQRGVRLEFIQPGRPTQNGYIESFNGKFPRNVWSTARPKVPAARISTALGLMYESGSSARWRTG
jgi:putative transposase